MENNISESINKTFISGSIDGNQFGTPGQPGSFNKEQLPESPIWGQTRKRKAYRPRVKHIVTLADTEENELEEKRPHDIQESSLNNLIPIEPGTNDSSAPLSLKKKIRQIMTHKRLLRIAEAIVERALNGDDKSIDKVLKALDQFGDFKDNVNEQYPTNTNNTVAIMDGDIIEVAKRMLALKNEATDIKEVTIETNITGSSD